MSIRFKLCPELGDGETWSIVSEPKLAAEIVEMWCEARQHDGAIGIGPGESCTIETVDKTDEEVAALPDL